MKTKLEHPIPSHEHLYLSIPTLFCQLKIHFLFLNSKKPLFFKGFLVIQYFLEKKKRDPKKDTRLILLIKTKLNDFYKRNDFSFFLRPV